MKKTLLASAMLIGLAPFGEAHAADLKGIYLGAKVGAAFMEADGIKNTSDVANPAAVTKTSTDDTVAVFGMSLGYDWASKGLPVRTELEYAYRHGLSYDSDPLFVNAGVPVRATSDLNSHTLMVNGYYDFKNQSKFTPFVGAGLGMSWNKTDTDGTVIATGASEVVSRSESSFAWNLGAGVAYELTENMSLDTMYRYTDLGDAVWGRSSAELTSKDITSHELTVGLRFKF